jgi:hypothetical protein
LLLFGTPPCWAVANIISTFKKEKRRVQFGIPELLVLPLVGTPVILELLFMRKEFYLLVLILTVYQFVFAALCWSMEKPLGWKPALALVWGSMAGLVVLVVWSLLSFMIFGLMELIIGG